MKKDNLTFLQENLRYLGFGEALPLNDQLDQKVEAGEKEFQLTTEVHFDEWSRIEATLYFRKADQLDMYFFNKYIAYLSYHDRPDHNKEQTFYINKGSGVSLKEAFNLLQGRAVNKNLTNFDGEKYNAWIQLDFGARTSNNNYKVRQFRSQYGYDLEKVLYSYPIRELQEEELKANLIRSLKKGNVHPVTFAKTNKIEKMYIEACPQFKTISIYSLAVRAAQSAQKLNLQRDLRGKESIAFSPAGLERSPGDNEGDGEIEKDEEREMPVEVPVHTDGSPAKKRSRKSVD
jgi:hypothetical protein